MVATQTKFGNKQIFQMSNDTVFLSLEKSDQPHLTIKNILDQKEAKGNIKTVLSDNPKAYVSFGTSFYHFWHDEVAVIISMYEHNPNIEFLIEYNNIAGSVRKDMVDFVFKAFDYYNINYTPINSDEIDGILINNLIKHNVNPGYDHNMSDKIYNFVQPFIKNKNIKPFRKVYLSRSGIPDRTYTDMTVDELSLPENLRHDNRINSHKAIEDYFESLGFEVIVPEKDFANIEEQINYAYTIKTFASLTSSGISNAVFMQPNQTLIEVVTPLVMYLNKHNFIEEVHHFFSMIAFNKGHMYLGIPNYARDIDLLIKTIESNSRVFNLLKSE